MANTESGELVKLKGVIKRDGIVVPKEVYDMISDFIVSSLVSAKDERMTLNELIEKVKDEVDVVRNGKIFWYLLQIKQDLEAKKVITVIVGRNRIQYLQLAKKAKEMIK